MPDHLARVDSFVNDIQRTIQEHEAQTQLLAEISRRLCVQAASGDTITSADLLKRVDQVMIRLSLIR